MLIPSLDSGITANVVHMASDKNDRFVLKRCVTYMIRHFERFPSFDEETLKILCWVLGEDMARIGRFLLDHADPEGRSELKKELSECDLDPDDYARTLHDSFKRAKSVKSKQLRAFILKLLLARYKQLKYRGVPEIEKNALELQKMFGLSEAETDFAVFLFIITNYQAAEMFFDNHLECTKFLGQKYLANILGLNRTELKAVFYGCFQGFFVLIRHCGLHSNMKFTTFERTSLACRLSLLTQEMPRVATCQKSLSSISAIEILNLFAAREVIALMTLLLSLREPFSGMRSLI